MQEAQRAFREGDAEYSKEVHQSMAAEEHDAFGEFVKVMVFGGLDGIITTFAVVASIAGADLKIEVRTATGAVTFSRRCCGWSKKLASLAR